LRVHENGTFWPTLILIGTSLLSVGLTVGLHRMRLNAVLAWLIGGTTPAFVIVVAGFYLEAQQPVGPFWAVVGILLGGGRSPSGCRRQHWR
jgi:hypothetical protein